ncbi:hypothetical protein [Clostridium sp. CF012]|nr:hypothetical protein [Clostridium sp. CF012]MBU3144614.1 hypothetical protein [Clostridium sp. CF012]
MDILKIIKIISIVLQLIVSGLSQSESITGASAKFGVSENLIKRFMKI